MNTVLEDELIVEDIVHEEYLTANDDDVVKISERLLEQHKEAYRALANT